MVFKNTLLILTEKSEKNKTNKETSNF